MTLTGIEAKKTDLRQLFTDFWFKIPSYQRSYVWERDNILSLLDDLYFAFTNSPEKEYFVGSLVLQDVSLQSYKEFEVLDGQQRLTTFFMLHAVIRDLATNELLINTAQKRIFQEANEFDNIPERIRIIFNIRDDVENFVKNNIAQLGSTKSIASNKSVAENNISTVNMLNAITVMTDYLKEKNNIEDFAKFVMKNVIFIYVATTNMEDAYRLFTVLNNRGVPLTNADIIKTINIGAITKDKTDKYAKYWEDIESDFGQDFDRFLSFIRTIILKDKARTNLVKEFEEKIYNNNLLKKGVDTIDFVRKFARHYDDIVNLESAELNNRYKNLITAMLAALPSEDWVPPLLFYKDKFGYSDIDVFAEKLESKFSGDWISQLDPTQRIENMNLIMRHIDIASDHQDVICSHVIFETNNETIRRVLSGDVYGKKFTKHILLKYELLNNDNSVHLSNYDYISVEHVLPQTPPAGSEWEKQFTEEERKVWTNRLANLVLLNRRKNASLSNLAFPEKKEKYFKGKMDVFVASKVFISNSTEWSIETLQNREQAMLDLLAPTT